MIENYNVQVKYTPIRNDFGSFSPGFNRLILVEAIERHLSGMNKLEQIGFYGSSVIRVFEEISSDRYECEFLVVISMDDTEYEGEQPLFEVNTLSGIIDEVLTKAEAGKLLTEYMILIR